MTCPATSLLEIPSVKQEIVILLTVYHVTLASSYRPRVQYMGSSDARTWYPSQAVEKSIGMLKHCG